MNDDFKKESLVRTVAHYRKINDETEDLYRAAAEGEDQWLGCYMTVKAGPVDLWVTARPQIHE